MILFVGIANSQLVDLAKAKDVNAVLITEENFKDITFNVGYTSIEEFSNKQVFLNLLFSASEIFYQPETFTKTVFNINNPTMTTRGLTENFLSLAIQRKVIVHNFSFLGKDTVDLAHKIYLNLADNRKSDSNPQLWGAGCSFTYGVGVNYNERYINLVSNELNMPVSCLAAPGSSLGWAADQILRSDIRKGDIVVWGLTIKARLPLADNDKINHCSIEWINLLEGVVSKQALIESLSNDSDLTYQQLTHIYQVVNFCNKVGAKIVLLGLLTSATDMLYLNHLSEFVQCYKDFIDYGTDNAHPGPKHHQYYASTLLQVLNK